jgi:hypothetical protein
MGRARIKRPGFVSPNSGDAGSETWREDPKPPNPAKRDRVSKGMFRSERILVNKARLESSSVFAWRKTGRQKRSIGAKRPHKSRSFPGWSCFRKTSLP